jgi:hypothetical protein
MRSVPRKLLVPAGLLKPETDWRQAHTREPVQGLTVKLD